MQNAINPLFVSICFQFASIRLHCKDLPLWIPASEELVFVLVDLHVGHLRGCSKQRKLKELWPKTDQHEDLPIFRYLHDLS